MSERDYIHPLAYGVLHETREHKSSRVKAWEADGAPLLTPRASAVLRAIWEHGFEMCIGYKEDGGTLLKYPECTRHGPCSVKTICRAWRES